MCTYIFSKKEPINFYALHKSPIRISISCYDVKSQKFEYFINKNITLEVLRATKAVPFVYRKKIKIGNNLYQDHMNPIYDMIISEKKNLIKYVLNLS